MSNIPSPPSVTSEDHSATSGCGKEVRFDKAEVRQRARRLVKKVAVIVTMDEFSYLSVLLSIILGLAITQILKGFRGMLQSRDRVRPYWPALAWAVLLLVIYVQTWWAMFGLRSHHDWTFGAFAIVLLQTIVLYMLAGLVLPDFFGDQPVDLRANYYAHRGWFFGLAVLAGFVSIGKDFVLDGGLPEFRNLAFHIVFVATATVAAITRREWYHKVMVLVTACLFGCYITLLFAHLR
jgi:hypothetical protein